MTRQSAAEVSGAADDPVDTAAAQRIGRRGRKRGRDQRQLTAAQLEIDTLDTPRRYFTSQRTSEARHTGVRRNGGQRNGPLRRQRLHDSEEGDDFFVIW
jgi:hypothetical protein